jgi:NAD-dependent SIR2 family protein deacetylase
LSEFSTRVAQFSQALENADVILIGAGAGLSASAGLTYSGERFERNFSQFIEKYHMTDMYSAGFYPFATQEEKWAYWFTHIDVNRHQPKATEIYLRLFELLKNRAHFVITTNVDYQFYKAGFEPDNIFAPQGDYGKLQCSQPCHGDLYDNEALATTALANLDNCLIPSANVPKCPKCGCDMLVNIRADHRFVENDTWHRSANAYADFVNENLGKNMLLIEIGVGYNTPTIIKYPFEQITSLAANATLVRINRDEPEVSDTNRHRTIAFREEVIDILKALA